MNMPKLLLLFTLFLFGVIGLSVLFKQKAQEAATLSSQVYLEPIEIKQSQEVQTFSPAPSSQAPVAINEKISNVDSLSVEREELDEEPVVKEKEIRSFSKGDLPEVDRIEEFFNTKEPKLPIVETITYKSRVSWQKGRPAWLSDYASHYKTSRHFIARSLNKKPDYLKQEINEGDRFNVLRQDKNFSFYLLVDSSRCRLWFYYIDLDENKPVLLKTYRVGLGRIDSSKTSGLLTPLGKYSLGNKIAVYQPKSMGTYHGKNTEMITVFGTRWVPFEKEIGVCTSPAKGFGIHGTPWRKSDGSKLVDDQSSLGKYESDGCIRMASEDVEEIYSIIITKPAVIEIVRDFFESSLQHYQD